MYRRVGEFDLEMAKLAHWDVQVSCTEYTELIGHCNQISAKPRAWQMGKVP